MTTISFTPGPQRVPTPAPKVDDRDLTDRTLVARNLEEDRRIVREEVKQRRRLFNLHALLR
jgi:hypothetical protein